MGEGLYKTLKFAFDCFVEVIFPRSKNCALCGRILKDENRFYLCSSCMPQIKPVNLAEEHEKYSLIELAFDDWISFALYEGAARDMVHRLKYRDKREIASAMAALLDRKIREQGIAYDLIVPVPLSKKRFNKRGYNQAELIARELSNITNINLKLVLNKIKDTGSQVLCNADERWYNVKGAFKCDTELAGKRILLVDDVITTGATVHYCAEELKAKGAKIVYAVSFAKASL